MSTESSPELQPLTEAAADTNSDVNSVAESSTATTEGEKSTLDVVRAALQAPTEESPASTEPGKDAKAADPKPETEDEPPADPSEDDLRKYKPETARRMRHLLQQRDETKRTLDEVQPLAESAKRLNSFLAESNLTSEDLSAVLDIAKAIRNDPIKGYERLMAIAEQLKPTVGAVLPPDLKQQVELGYVTEAAANETARLRAQTQLQDRRAQEQSQRAEAERVQAQQRELVDTVSRAATDWERQIQRTDPDYPLKASRLQELVELEVRRTGFPQSPQAAVELSKRMYDRVNDELKRLRPAPREIKPAVGVSSTRATPEPQSTLDIIRGVVGSN